MQGLAVDTWDARSHCDIFLNGHPQYTMPILLDPTSSETAKSAATNLYGVVGIPTTVIIDKEGIVRTYAIGVHEHEFYMNALKALGVNIHAQ